MPDESVVVLVLTMLVSLAVALTFREAVLRSSRSRDTQDPRWEDEPIHCGNCGRWLGTASRHDGIGMLGEWYCDTICYMDRERSRADERSLNHHV